MARRGYSTLNKNKFVAVHVFLIAQLLLLWITGSRHMVSVVAAHRL